MFWEICVPNNLATHCIAVSCFIVKQSSHRQTLSVCFSLYRSLPHTHSFFWCLLSRKNVDHNIANCHLDIMVIKTILQSRQKTMVPGLQFLYSGISYEKRIVGLASNCFLNSHIKKSFASPRFHKFRNIYIQME